MPVEIPLVASLVIALSYWLEKNTKWVLHISSTVFIIILACILANSGVISPSPEVYDPIFKWCVPVGIALVLMAFDPKHVFQIKKEFLICFGIGTIASVIGGVIAGLLFTAVLPEDYWKATGQLTASYIGGYENAIAVGSSLNIPTQLFVQLFAADSILTALWILFNIYQGKRYRLTDASLPSTSRGLSAGSHDASPFLDIADKPRDVGMREGIDETRPINIKSIAVSLVVALFILFAANWLTSFFPDYSNSKIILVSLLATLVTFTPLRNHFSGSYVFGSILLSFFFFACGAISNVVSLVNDLSILILFPATIVVIHGVILFSCTKLLKIEKDIASISSQTLIGGPATALAVVMALKLPYRFEAIALGLVGYAIASYIGIATALIVKAM